MRLSETSKINSLCYITSVSNVSRKRFESLILTQNSARGLNAGLLGVFLNIPKLILLLLLLFSFACTDSKEEFDTSPFDDKELLPYEPLWDLMDAVIVFEKKHQELPKDLLSLKNLSRQDYIDACITDGLSDSIIVDDSKLNFFSNSETRFSKIPSGLEIQYEFKDSSLIWFDEWDESLYSTDFEAYTFKNFIISVEIEKGKGTMKIDLDLNRTEISTEELLGSFGLSPELKFHLINEQIVFENAEPLCFEE